MFAASREAITGREDEAEDQPFGYGDAGKKLRICNCIIVWFGFKGNRNVNKVSK